MAEATFRKGNPRMIAYTPAAGALAAGEVVLLGNLTGVANGITHLPIANSTLGSLAVGGGVYDCVNLNNAANYAIVYWDTSTNKVTTVSTNMSTFGYVVEGGGGGANTTCKVLHVPYV